MKQTQKKWLIIIAIGLVALTLFRPTDNNQQNTEKTLQEVLRTIEGVGDVEIYYEESVEQNKLFSTLSEDNNGKGILIVCEGATSEKTKRMLVDSISAVLNIPPHQIKVLPMQREEQN